MTRVTALLLLVPLATLAVVASVILWPSGSTPTDVFSGVSPEELQSVGVTILNENPTASPSVEMHDIASLYTQNRVALEAARLVSIDVQSPAIAPALQGEHMAWALRLDPNEGISGWGRHTDAMIAFFDARSGTIITTYIREPATPT